MVPLTPRKLSQLAAACDIASARLEKLATQLDALAETAQESVKLKELSSEYAALADYLRERG